MTQIEHRPPRLTAEAWAHAREDCIAGVSVAVIAERSGTTDRSVRRRAALEGWRRRDFLPARVAPPPPWMAGPCTKDEEIETDPALEEVDAAASTSRFGLLFNPHPRTLGRVEDDEAAETEEAE